MTNKRLSYSDRCDARHLLTRALAHLTEALRTICDSPERMYDMAELSSTRDTLPAIGQALRIAGLLPDTRASRVYARQRGVTVRP